jgi:succinate-semialdehyde dehydrogenase / glutarate-semialdehyde dehydrogenase
MECALQVGMPALLYVSPSRVTMIGSTETGLSVIRDSTTSIKHFSLELGGNAPVAVMEDADVK